MRRRVLYRHISWIPIIFCVALPGCGGGGDSGPLIHPTTTIQGAVSGTIIVAIDETGTIAARDDTAGETPIDNTAPPKFRFTLNVSKGHRYHLYFIVAEGTPSQRIVPLYFGTTNVFSVGTASSIDLGFVDTSAPQATAEKNPFSIPGVTPGPETGPNTIRLEGFKFFILIDNYDGRKRYRVQAQVKDAAGDTLTDGSLVKDMNVYSPTRAELPQDDNFFLFNGSNSYYDGGGGIGPLSQSDLETYLVAAPGSLSYGFYTVLVTDNNGNLYTTTIHHGAPVEVSKPTGLSQTINADNTITLSWTNPAGISSPGYQVYADVVCDDGNGDGQIDFLLYVNLVSKDNTYTIPAGFAQTTLAGKTGLKWMAEIRQQTTTPVTFPDGNSSNVPLYRVRSPLTVLTLPTTAFTQADVTGTWDVIQFDTGFSPGWMFATMSADGSGDLSASYLLTSDGLHPGPYPVDKQSRLVIDGNGILSIYDTSSGSPVLEGSFHGTMSSRKNLFVATDNDFTTPDPPTYAMIVARKRGGISYDNVDFRGKAFVYHSLYSGDNTIWEYGYGRVDALGRVSLDNATDPFHLSGTVPGLPLENFATLSVDSNGVVTDNTGTMHGMMSADKTTAFAVITNNFNPPRYQLMVFNILGAACTQADLGGNWWWHSLNYLAWARGNLFIDPATGGITHDNNTTMSSLGPFTDTFLGPILVDSTGQLTTPVEPLTFHGQLSAGKDLYVRTRTSGPNSYNLVISVK